MSYVLTILQLWSTQQSIELIAAVRPAAHLYCYPRKKLMSTMLSMQNTISVLYVDYKDTTHDNDC
jgi:hypothetical protein